MKKVWRSLTKADLGCLIVFLLGITTLFFFNAWWPQMLVVIGAALIARQYVGGRFFDIAITAGVTGSLFLNLFLNISWDTLMPSLMCIAILYIVIREYCASIDTRERIYIKERVVVPQERQERIVVPQESVEIVEKPPKP